MFGVLWAGKAAADYQAQAMVEANREAKRVSEANWTGYTPYADETLKTDEPQLSAETLADRAAGMRPLPKAPAKAVKELDGPQTHTGNAVPTRALRIGWER